RGGREIVPGHVRCADIDAPVGHDVLGVIHARMARIPAHTSAGAVPARNDELLNLELARGHVAIRPPGVGCLLQRDQEGRDQAGSVGPFADQQPDIDLARQHRREKRIEQARPPYRRVVRNGTFAAERYAGALATEECYRGEIHHTDAYGFARVVDGADQPFLVRGPPRIEDLARAGGEEDGPPLYAEVQGGRRLQIAGGLRLAAEQRVQFDM